MNGTNQKQSLVKSDLRYYFIRLTIFRACALYPLASSYKSYVSVYLLALVVEAQALINMLGVHTAGQVNNNVKWSIYTSLMIEH